MAIKKTRNQKKGKKILLIPTFFICRGFGGLYPWKWGLLSRGLRSSLSPPNPKPPILQTHQFLWRLLPCVIVCAWIWRRCHCVCLDSAVLRLRFPGVLVADAV